MGHLATWGGHMATWVRHPLGHGADLEPEAPMGLVWHFTVIYRGHLPMAIC